MPGKNEKRHKDRGKWLKINCLKIVSLKDKLYTKGTSVYRCVLIDLYGFFLHNKEANAVKTALKKRGAEKREA